MGIEQITTVIDQRIECAKSDGRTATWTFVEDANLVGKVIAHYRNRGYSVLKSSLSTYIKIDWS